MRRLVKAKPKPPSLSSTEAPDINAKNNNGNTPLHWAVRLGQTETTIALINGGANVNARNDKDETPTDVAQRLGKTKVLYLLKERGGKTH